MGRTTVVKREIEKRESILGAELQPVGSDEKSKLKIDNGVKIAKLGSGKIKDAGISEGFIITHVDKKAVKSAADVTKAIKNIKGPFLIEGIYPDGTKAYRAVEQ
jgi:S1-C subfamily serine protease